MGICDVQYDETGTGYYANCTPAQLWGSGVKFPTQAACTNSCAATGEGGCGACTYVPPMPPPPPMLIRGQPPMPNIEPQADTDAPMPIDPKIIIIAVIALILLLRR